MAHEEAGLVPGRKPEREVRMPEKSGPLIRRAAERAKQMAGDVMLIYDHPCLPSGSDLACLVLLLSCSLACLVPTTYRALGLRSPAITDDKALLHFQA